MRLYLAGPLFHEAERAWLDALAGRLRADGFDCFVPHEQFEEMTTLTPDEVYRTDAEGLRSSNALVAWLDGAAVDDGTACEIGMFAQLVAGGDPRYVGIVGIATDLRLERGRDVVAGDGLNLFLGGAVSACGRLCWSVDEAIETLASWRTSGRRRDGSPPRSRGSSRYREDHRLPLATVVSRPTRERARGLDSRSVMRAWG